MEFICMIDAEKNCEYLIGEEECKGNPACAFCEKGIDEREPVTKYARKERRCL